MIVRPQPRLCVVTVAGSNLTSSGSFAVHLHD